MFLTKYNYQLFRINYEQQKQINTGNITLPINDTSDVVNSSISLNSTTSPVETWWLDPIFRQDNAIIFYSVMYALTVITFLLRSVALSHWCVVAATRLHNLMFRNILNSPMLFFNRNPSGRILNRFSKDTGAVDEIVPSALGDTVQVI